MKRDVMTEKAAIAFRDYARLGLCASGSALDTVCRIRGLCSDEEALDMLAVFDTLRLLEASGETLALRAVRDIYFATAKKKPHANEITLRIRRLSDEVHCDDRTVYRHLQKARDLWHFLRSRENKQAAGERSLLTYILAGK